jgi:hypothetical protein
MSDGGPRRLSRRRALTLGGAAAAAVGTLSIPDGGSDWGADGDENPFTRLHEAGITGEGVRVGVLDTTGFDPGHPAVEANVAELRGFDGATPVVDRTSHGTAAAATVTRLTPDADLVLAAFERPSGFAAGVDWFRRQGVDVALAPVAAHGTAGPESSVVDAAAAAVDAGLPFVAPTGNVARGHWAGPLGSLVTDEGESAAVLRVQPLPGRETTQGRLVAWLGGAAQVRADLTLALVKRSAAPNPRDLIALSRPGRWNDAERLVAELDAGRYELEVRSPDHATAPASIGRDSVAVATPTHRLTPARPAGSIAAPASAPGVLAVGAAAGTGAAAYSGRGPTRDGRDGVDLVADPRPWPGSDDPGTSGAAARAAGTAALVRGVDGSRSPEELWTVLRAAAADIDGEGSSLATGAGRLDPVAAVQRARTTS